MKIFITIPWFQPAYKAGGPIQSVANMVKQLAVSSGQSAVSSGQPTGSCGWAVGNDAMEFKIFCSNKDLDGSLLQGVAFDEWVPYNAHTKVWYSSNNNILPVLQEEIQKEKSSYLFITGIYDWQFNAKPLLFCKGVKKIVSVRGMLHPGALSQKSFKKKIYLGFWKLLGLYKQWAVGSGQSGNVFHATDEAEKKYIQQVFGPSVHVKVAANFPNVLDVQPVVQKKPGQLKLVSVALVSAMKNILWVLEGLSLESGVVSRESGVGSREEKGVSRDWSLVSGQSSVVSVPSSVVNNIEYNIYGPIKDKPYWEACEAQIKKLPPNITVNYHGDIVPDKIDEALAANHVFILPSKSENYGHSMYEALSAGRPVITSNHTPWNKLEAAKAGINVSLNEPTELVQAIKLFAAMGQEELDTWSKGARAYAETAVDVDEIRRQYEEMFG